MPNKTLRVVKTLHEMIASLEDIEDTAEKDNWELAAYISAVRSTVNEHMAMVESVLHPKVTFNREPLDEEAHREYALDREAGLPGPALTRHPGGV